MKPYGSARFFSNQPVQYPFQKIRFWLVLEMRRWPAMFFSEFEIREFEIAGGMFPDSQTSEYWLLKFRAKVSPETLVNLLPISNIWINSGPVNIDANRPTRFLVSLVCSIIFTNINWNPGPIVHSYRIRCYDRVACLRKSQFLYPEPPVDVGFRTLSKSSYKIGNEYPTSVYCA